MKQRATVVCRQGTRVLLVGREQSRWSLPGGRPEVGETLEDAALRELFEETCLRAAALKFMFEFAGAHTRHHVFVAEVAQGQFPVPSNEIAHCWWAKVTDVPKLATSVSTKGIVSLLAMDTRRPLRLQNRRERAQSFVQNLRLALQEGSNQGQLCFTNAEG
ncbi:NUDIX hydrolase [Paraburkholderia lacunae]|uniref:NUDIX hydrolase n=1 Tax=Paraburkholderia lacunae TaxID=2211104 RepID=A0A370NAT6_9BURK|nr:NUDIX domain-containing protein [Paraburkholderia lacunae]RDK02727.1 NUDIX hydrolase [Paraburkholderia lacunae]